MLKKFLRFRKIRTNLRRGMIIFLLIFAGPTALSCTVGFPLVFIGQIIHFISSGYLVKKDELITAGPYRYVRNPFYVGSFLTDLGVFIAANNIIIPLIFIPLFYGFVIFRRTLREEDLLLSNFGRKYLDYLKNIPRFIPKISPATTPCSGSFKWEQIQRHKEISRTLRAFSLWLLFLFTSIEGNPDGYGILSINIRNGLTSNGIIVILILLILLILPELIKLIMKPNSSSKENAEKNT